MSNLNTEIQIRPEIGISPEIQEIREILLKLLQKLIQPIKNQDYQLLISDDISGRIPAEIIQRGANLFYAKSGKQKIQLFGIRGGWNFQDAIKLRRDKIQHATQAEIDIARLKQKINSIPNPKRVLLITEYIETGNTIINLTRKLVELGLQTDVASMGIKSNPDQYPLIVTNRTGSNLFYGDILQAKPSIWNRPDLLGYNRETISAILNPNLENDINTLAKEFEKMLIT